MLYCRKRKKESRKHGGKTEEVEQVFTEYTRLGKYIVVERFTAEEKRVLAGEKLKPGEEERHKEMVKQRFSLFEELKKRSKDWDF